MTASIRTRLEALELPHMRPCLPCALARLRGAKIDQCTHPHGQTLHDVLAELNRNAKEVSHAEQ